MITPHTTTTLGVPPPALQITFPQEDSLGEVIRALDDAQGVTALYVNQEQGVRLYRDSDYSTLTTVFKRFPYVDVVWPPTTVFNLVAKEMCMSRPTVEWETCSIPKALQAKLMPFQRDGIEYAVSRGGRCLIGDEMGLGKTIQAISLLSFYHSEWPALIIVPASLKFDWKESILQELRFLSPATVQIVDSGKDALTGGIVIVSYDTARNFDVDMLCRRFKVVVLDESHSIKNEKSQRYQKLRKVLEQSARLFLLTGTPTVNRPIELYTQLCCITAGRKGDIFSKRYEFSGRYCDKKLTAFGSMDYTGHSNLQELQYLLRLVCMIRRQKHKVLPELPDKKRVEIHVNITQAEQKEMENAVFKLKDRFRSLDEVALDEDIMATTAASGKSKLNKTQIIHLYNATAKAKRTPVCEYVAQHCANGEKILLFAYHLDMLNALETCVQGLCDEHNEDADAVRKDGMWDHIRIDGQVSNSEVRKKRADYFQNTPSCKYAILSIAACGAGLTLHRSCNVIFAELCWTPGDLIQAEDRVHRIGQKEVCTIRYILARGTCDDHLWPLLKKKMSVVGATLNMQGLEDQITEWSGKKQEFQRQGIAPPLLKAVKGKPKPKGGSALVQTKLNFGAAPKSASAPVAAPAAAPPPASAATPIAPKRPVPFLSTVTEVKPKETEPIPSNKRALEDPLIPEPKRLAQEAADGSPRPAQAPSTPEEQTATADVVAVEPAADEIDEVMEVDPPGYNPYMVCRRGVWGRVGGAECMLW